MTKKKMTRVGDGSPGPGRKKGVPNKITMVAREAVAMAFEGIGGVPKLIEWAKKSDENRKIFYTMVWPKIIPLQVGMDPNNPITVTHIELVAPAIEEAARAAVDLIEYRGESTH